MRMQFSDAIGKLQTSPGIPRLRSEQIRGGTMRKLLMLLFVTVVVMSIVPPVCSQISTEIRAKVDSNFVVGNIHLTAGEYIFAIDPSSNRMRISNMATRETVYVFVQERSDNSTSITNKLVFQKNGDEMFLHKVWSEPDRSYYDIVHGEELTELQ
jgi:hypothetical protein